MGAKDSKPSCITYEDAVKRSMMFIPIISINIIVNLFSTRLSFLKPFRLFILVSDSELKRLREAFKRLLPLNGAITKHSFIKEVLGDGVPLSIADV